MKKIAVRVLTKLLSLLTGYQTKEEIIDYQPVVFCKPFTEEDVYKESEGIDDFIKNIGNIKK